MPAVKGSINLIEKDSSQSPVWNQLIGWVTTYGRYIMITTELIVLMAFASRFSLDRKLTDLKEDIMQKQEILEVNAPLEAEIRQTQEKLASVKSIITAQQAPATNLTAFQSLIPSGVYAQTLSLDTTKLTANISSVSTDAFLRFLGNVSTTKTFAVELGSINKQKGIIECTMDAAIQGSKEKIIPTK